MREGIIWFVAACMASALVFAGLAVLVGLGAARPGCVIGGIAACATVAALLARHHLGRRATALALTFAVLLVGPSAFAEDAAVAGSFVALPWGDWTAAVLHFAGDNLGILVAAAVAALLRRLPGELANMLAVLRVEQLLDRAIGYGINTAAGAARGRVLRVDVGNAVLAEALRYAVAQAPALVRWAGGPEGIAAKIWARLDLEGTAAAPDFAAAARKAIGSMS